MSNVSPIDSSKYNPTDEELDRCISALEAIWEKGRELLGLEWDVIDEYGD